MGFNSVFKGLKFWYPWNAAISQRGASNNAS